MFEFSNLYNRDNYNNIYLLELFWINEIIHVKQLENAETSNNSMILYYNSPIIINIIIIIIMCVNFIRPVSDIVSDRRKGGILSEWSWNESI